MLFIFSTSTGELERPFLIGFFQGIEELALKEFAKHPNREDEVMFAAFPLVTILVIPAAGDYTM